MSVLHVALEEGFSNDEVRVSVAGARVYGKNGVTTRLQTGLADSFDADVKGDGTQVEIDVQVPRRRSRERFAIALRAQTFLGISLTPSGQVRHRISSEPFGYV